jgi:hypothetical protein
MGEGVAWINYIWTFEYEGENNHFPGPGYHHGGSVVEILGQDTYAVEPFPTRKLFPGTDHTLRQWDKIVGK